MRYASAVADSSRWYSRTDSPRQIAKPVCNLTTPLVRCASRGVKIWTTSWLFNRSALWLSPLETRSPRRVGKGGAGGGINVDAKSAPAPQGAGFYYFRCWDTACRVLLADCLKSAPQVPMWNFVALIP